MGTNLLEASKGRDFGDLEGLNGVLAHHLGVLTPSLLENLVGDKFT